MIITVQPFGKFEGRTVNKYTITEEPGIQVKLINYGAAVAGINVPDKNGSIADVVLGFDTMDGYIRSGHFYFGSICGRYSNRIAGGRFRISGIEYQVSKNIGIGCLHGGFRGFDKKYWDAMILPEGDGVLFSYRSIDGEEGFPGNLDAEVSYRVIESALHIGYRAVTDKASPVNLTNHSYFNLSGGTEKDILSHELRICADKIVEVDQDYMPTGKLADIKGSPLDFRQPKRIGGVNRKPLEFDYSWVVNNKKGELAEVASLLHKESGRQMTVFTTQPAVHFFSGHLLDGQLPDTKRDINYGKYAGLCLEAQHFPDSPNHPEFPNTIIEPGEVYTEKTIFSFRRDK